MIFYFHTPDYNHILAKLYTYFHYQFFKLKIQQTKQINYYQNQNEKQQEQEQKKWFK